MYESLPKVVPGQKLSAKHLNMLSQAQRQGEQQTTGMGNSLNNYGTFSANVPQMPYHQRVVRIDAIRDENKKCYDVSQLQYNGTEWVSDGLGPWLMDSSFTPDLEYKVDDVLVAYFDYQRYAYLPIASTGGDKSSKRLWCGKITSVIEYATEEITNYVTGKKEKFYCAYRGEIYQVAPFSFEEGKDLCNPKINNKNDQDIIFIDTNPRKEPLEVGTYGYVRWIGPQIKNADGETGGYYEDEVDFQTVTDIGTTEYDTAEVYQWCCGCPPKEEPQEAGITELSEFKAIVRSYRGYDAIYDEIDPTTGKTYGELYPVSWKLDTAKEDLGRSPGNEASPVDPFANPPADFSIWVVYSIANIPQGAKITSAELRKPYISPEAFLDQANEERLGQGLDPITEFYSGDNDYFDSLLGYDAGNPKIVFGKFNQSPQRRLDDFITNPNNKYPEGTIDPIEGDISNHWTDAAINPNGPYAPWVPNIEQNLAFFTFGGVNRESWDANKKIANYASDGDAFKGKYQIRIANQDHVAIYTDLEFQKQLYDAPWDAGTRVRKGPLNCASGDGIFAERRTNPNGDLGLTRNFFFGKNPNPDQRFLGSQDSWRHTGDDVKFRQEKIFIGWDFEEDPLNPTPIYDERNEPYLIFADVTDQVQLVVNRPGWLPYEGDYSEIGQGVVAFRIDDDGSDRYLIPRLSDDPTWPNDDLYNFGVWFRYNFDLYVGWEVPEDQVVGEDDPR